MIRSPTIELISRILLQSPDKSVRSARDTSCIPREVHLIKVLIEKLKDRSNRIKLKAVQTLQTVLTKGSPTSIKIITECVKYSMYSEVDVKLPKNPHSSNDENLLEKSPETMPTYTFKGHELLQQQFLDLPDCVYTHLFNNPVVHIRCAGVMLMEHLIRMNPQIICGTHFIKEITHLMEERNSQLRKEILWLVDGILICHPRNYSVIWAWCEIIALMLNDPDPKNIELAMAYFCLRVFRNMRPFRDSYTAEHLMPWIIIKAMLSAQSRMYLRNCFHKALKEDMISQNTLEIIVSHLVTNNATEAWSALNFISVKVKIAHPDVLLHYFMQLNSYDDEECMLIALEVLISCVKDFSHAALNNVFNQILSQIQDGLLAPGITGKALNFLVDISNYSSSLSRAATSSNSAMTCDPWLLKLYNTLENRIITAINYFPRSHLFLMSYLYSYSEVNTQTQLRPHPAIISFIHQYLSHCAELSEYEVILDDQRIFNSMIWISGRLSLHDTNIAHPTMQIYADILQHFDNPTIVKTILVSLADLCKIPTSAAEHITEPLLAMLSSSYVINRVTTFEFLENLILQDKLKLSGPLLLALLSTILDENETLAARARSFFADFFKTKNAAIFEKCLKECPFLFNEYENFEGTDMSDCTSIKSPLKGENNRIKREMLYKHLLTAVDKIDSEHLYSELSLLKDGIKSDDENAMFLLMDVTFILEEISKWGNIHLNSGAVRRKKKRT